MHDNKSQVLDIIMSDKDRMPSTVFPDPDFNYYHTAWRKFICEFNFKNVIYKAFDDVKDEIIFAGVIYGDKYCILLQHSSGEELADADILTWLDTNERAYYIHMSRGNPGGRNIKHSRFFKCLIPFYPMDESGSLFVEDRPGHKLLFELSELAGRDIDKIQEFLDGERFLSLLKIQDLSTEIVVQRQYLYAAWMLTANPPEGMASLSCSPFGKKLVANVNKINKEFRLPNNPEDIEAWSKQWYIILKREIMRLFEKDKFQYVVGLGEETSSDE